MDEQKFLDLLVDELEIEEAINMETNFRELEDWSSLMGFSILSFVKKNMQKEISPKEFIEMKNFKDIYKKTKK
ncbi:MAG: hypothetical protein ACRC0V_07105 [Fusobacteriaceae bacterium]